MESQGSAWSPSSKARREATMRPHCTGRRRAPSVSPGTARRASTSRRAPRVRCAIPQVGRVRQRKPRRTSPLGTHTLVAAPAIPAGGKLRDDHHAERDRLRLSCDGAQDFRSRPDAQFAAIVQLLFFQRGPHCRVECNMSAVHRPLLWHGARMARGPSRKARCKLQSS